MKKILLISAITLIIISCEKTIVTPVEEPEVTIEVDTTTIERTVEFEIGG